MRRRLLERSGRSRWRWLVQVAAEGIFVGVLAAAILVGFEAILNRWVQQGLLFLPFLRLSFMAVLGAVAGGVASVVMALVLALLQALGRRAVAAGIVALGLAAGGLASHAAFAWRRALFPPATPGSIGWPTAALIASVLTALGGLLWILRAADGLRATRPGRAPAESRLRRLLRMSGAVSVAMALALGVAVPWLAAHRAAARPSVLLISIDTLRADRLGALGYERGLTPNLDHLAEGGAIFLQATATSPWTLPSHGSIFTSMLPFDHGGRWYVSPIRPQRSMLAERFRDAGYRTAAFTGGGWMDGDRGFYQGFEVYQEHDELAAGGSEGILAAAAGWVRGLGGRPYFLFVHTYEPHIPYLRRDFADPEDAGRLGETFDFDDLKKMRSGAWELNPGEQRFTVDLYDGDVANSDRQVGSFLAGIEQSGGLDDTIVVVLSDHGEDLWDHEPRRSADHGHSLYEELLRVPLLFWGPDRVKAGTRVVTPVSLLDVAPTLLAVAGVPHDPQHRGLDLTESLATGAEPAVRPVFAESVEYGPDRFSARVEDLKVIVTPFPELVHGGVELEVEALEVFDLATDPLESLNLAGTRDERVLAVAPDLLSRALGELGYRPARGRLGLPEQLRALGYVE